MAYQMPYGQTQSYQATQYFPQPQGNVYLINNSLEVSNIPVGAGLSIAICFNEGIIYIKTMQGGAPAISAYQLKPYEQPKQNSSNNLAERVAAIEKVIEGIKKKEGKLNELL